MCNDVVVPTNIFIKLAHAGVKVYIIYTSPLIAGTLMRPFSHVLALR